MTIVRFARVALLLLTVAFVTLAQPSAVTLTGSVLDISGTAVAGAEVTLVDSSDNHRVARCDVSGHYTFTQVVPGVYELNIRQEGFGPFTNPALTVTADPNQVIADVTLRMAILGTSIGVTASLQDVADAQLKSETKQRLFWMLPNFYVSYFSNPAPLSAGQKIKLALRNVIDPSTFGITAAIAASENDSEDWRAYGGGASGFARRFGALYGNAVFGSVFGSGVFPAVFRQDPRYLYKGTGSIRSRVLYALSYSFRCKGDNGRWQPNYSYVLGDVASAGLSDLYYPEPVRDSVSRTIGFTILDIGLQGVQALAQEFLLKHVTTHATEAGKLP